MEQSLATIDRLVRATNQHDLEALTACFAEDYKNETPAHPARGFRGRAQVRRNWEQIFAFVPDINVEVVGAPLRATTSGPSGRCEAPAETEGLTGRAASSSSVLAATLFTGLAFMSSR